MADKSDAEKYGELAFNKTKGAAVANVSILLKENYESLKALFPDIDDKPKAGEDYTSFNAEINRMAEEAIKGIPNQERGFNIKTKGGYKFISFSELDKKYKEKQEATKSDTYTELKTPDLLKENGVTSFSELVPTEKQINQIAEAIGGVVTSENSGLNWAGNIVSGAWRSDGTIEQEFALEIRKNSEKKLEYLARTNSDLKAILSPEKISAIGEEIYKGVIESAQKKDDGKEKKEEDIWKPDLNNIAVKELGEATKESIRSVARREIFLSSQEETEKAINKAIPEEIAALEKSDDFWDKIKSWFFGILEALGFADLVKPSNDDVTAVSKQVATTISKTITAPDFDYEILTREKSTPDKQHELNDLIKAQVLKELKENSANYSGFDDEQLEKIASKAGIAIEEQDNVKTMVSKIPPAIYNKKSAPTAAK